jgi:hypothetical protein
MDPRNNPFAPAQIDFSQLANLPDQYAAGSKWRDEQDKRTALRNLLATRGFDTNAIANTLLGFGDTENAAKFAAVGAHKPSTFTRIGTDDGGNPTYGWVNGGTQTLTPISQPQTTQQGPGGAPATGEDYLGALPPERQALIRSIARGDQSVPSYTRGGRQLLEQVNQYDPTYSQSIAPTRTATRKAFAFGKQGDAVTALNTLPGHLRNLNNSIDALNGYDTGMGAVDRWLNTARNYYSQGGGSPTGQALNQFNTDVNAVTEELERVWRGTGGNSGQIDQWRVSLNAANSPTAKHATVKEIASLVQSRVDALKDQQTRGMGTDKYNSTMIRPEDQGILDSLSSGQSLPTQQNVPRMPAAPNTPPQLGMGNAVPGAAQISTGSNARFKTPQNPTGTPPNPGNIAALKEKANDPNARAFFDEHFGQGAAEWFLRGGV